MIDSLPESATSGGVVFQFETQGYPVFGYTRTGTVPPMVRA